MPVTVLVAITDGQIGNVRLVLRTYAEQERLVA
jgi:hypothetical protein